MRIVALSAVVLMSQFAACSSESAPESPAPAAAFDAKSEPAAETPPSAEATAKADAACPGRATVQALEAYKRRYTEITGESL